MYYIYIRTQRVKHWIFFALIFLFFLVKNWYEFRGFYKICIKHDIYRYLLNDYMRNRWEINWKINNLRLYKKCITRKNVFDTTGDLRYFICFQISMVTTVNNQYGVIPNIIWNCSTFCTSILLGQKYTNGNW